MALERVFDNWDRVDELLQQATDLPPQDVEAFCAEACGNDQQLRSLVLALVSATPVSDQRMRDSISALADDLSEETLPIGERLGTYQIESLLGRGGMGEVYLASRADGQFEKQVVVKVIQRRLNVGEFVDHFRTERQVLATLSHPYIPALFDAGQLGDGRPYLVTEYVEGSLPVTDFCREQRLSLRKRLELIDRLAQAVQHAHSKLVLHLDIKPANILVLPDGTPKLLDFGIARLMSDPDTGFAAFTPDYASPEQLRGEAPTAASDIYSLGVLIYELLTGEKPLQSPRFADQQTKLAERDRVLERLSQPASLASVPVDLQAIVRKAMAVQSNDRYSSVEALIQDLVRYRDHRPVEARVPTIAYRATRYLRRNAVGLAVAAVIIGLLSAFATREFQLRTQAQLAFERAEREAETSRQVSEFLTNLFRVSDPSEARGSSVTARDLLDKGAERIGDELATQPQVAARMMQVIGNVYVQLGLFQSAIEQFEGAAAVRETIAGGDPGERFELLNKLADAYLRQGRFDDAEAILLAGVDEIKQIFGEEDIHLATSLRKLGDLYMRQRRLDEAEQMLLRGLPIRERAVGSEHPSYASHLTSLGIVYFEQRRYEEAEPLYLQAVAIIERTRGPEDPTLGPYLTNLGNLYGRMGHHEEAEKVLLRNMSISLASLEPDHPQIANIAMNLAVFYSEQQRLHDAERFGLQALDVFRRNFGEAHFRVGQAAYNVAEVWVRMERYEEAEAMLLSAIGTWRQVHDPDHLHFGYAYELAAAIYLGQSREAQAEDYLLRAIDVFEANDNERKRTNALIEYAKLLRATGRASLADRVDASLVPE